MVQWGIQANTEFHDTAITMEGIWLFLWITSDWCFKLLSGEAIALQLPRTHSCRFHFIPLDSLSAVYLHPWQTTFVKLDLRGRINKQVTSAREQARWQNKRGLLFPRQHPHAPAAHSFAPCCDQWRIGPSLNIFRLFPFLCTGAEQNT